MPASNFTASTYSAIGADAGGASQYRLSIGVNQEKPRRAGNVGSVTRLAVTTW